MWETVLLSVNLLRSGWQKAAFKSNGLFQWVLTKQLRMAVAWNRLSQCGVRVCDCCRRFRALIEEPEEGIERLEMFVRGRAWSYCSNASSNAVRNEDRQSIETSSLSSAAPWKRRRFQSGRGAFAKWHVHEKDIRVAGAELKRPDAGSPASPRLAH